MIQGLKDLLKKHGIDSEDTAQAVDSFISETLSATSEKMIPKHRFDAVNTAKQEAMREAEDYKNKLDALTVQLTESRKLSVAAEETQAKLATLQAQIDTEQASQWEKLSGFFNAREGDPNHSKAIKAKPLFVWAKPGETLTPQQVQENLSKAKPLVDTGFFDAPQGADVNGARPGTGGNPTEKPIVVWPI